MMSCPLCNCTNSRPSWNGATVYRNKRYEYLECDECLSLYTSPMPDAETLTQMYGDDYGQFLSVESAHSGNDGTQTVLNWLANEEKGTFLDYGCGAGNLLGEVAKQGWTCYGVEFDDETAEKFSKLHNLHIVNGLNRLPLEMKFDVIHLGDVIEHLTNVNQEIPIILQRLKPNGVIIAQGPLEANINLFLLGIRLKKTLYKTESSMAPYHVSLATITGQKHFFNRFGLKEIVFSAFETAHPAPETLPLRDMRNIRSTSLFFLRRVSQMVSRIFASRMGNRYFYIGRKVGS